jgi:hypothetical protein
LVEEHVKLNQYDHWTGLLQRFMHKDLQTYLLFVDGKSAKQIECHTGFYEELCHCLQVESFTNKAVIQYFRKGQGLWTLDETKFVIDDTTVVVKQLPAPSMHMAGS